MKLNLSLVACYSSLLLLFTLPINAQVTIGSTDKPNTFSILELVTTQRTGGLRLPQLDGAQYAALTLQLQTLSSSAEKLAAQGLTIFNKESGCLEFWNGSDDWIKLCTGTPFDASIFQKGQSTITGRTCFDLNTAVNDDKFGCGKNSDRTWSVNFNNPSERKVDYTFTSNSLMEGTISNVRYIIQDPHGVLLSSSLSGSLSLSGGTATIQIEFKPDVISRIAGRTRENPIFVKIHIIYQVSASGGGDRIVTATVKLQDCACCGAIIDGSSLLREFLCFNLGADDQADPFNPSMEINGNYYQWGRKEVAAWGPPNGDGHAIDNWVVFSYWEYFGIDRPNSTVKMNVDPCPDGYRIPNSDEWQGVFDYNAAPPDRGIKPTTPWVYNTPSGFMFGSSLFLPSTGAWAWDGAREYNRGLLGAYWSSQMFEDVNGIFARNYYAFFDDGINSPELRLNGRTLGFTIRCIAED